jgi:hypothetical protein
MQDVIDDAKDINLGKEIQQEEYTIKVKQPT